MPRSGSSSYTYLPDTNTDDDPDHSVTEGNTIIRNINREATALGSAAAASGQIGGDSTTRAATTTSTLAGGDAGKSVSGCDDEGTPLKPSASTPPQPDTSPTSAKLNTAGAKDSKDLTEGLPTAEGVFVGSPVQEAHYAHHAPPLPGGMAPGSASQARTTVITATAPPGYTSRLVGAAVVGGVAAGNHNGSGGYQVAGGGAGGRVGAAGGVGGSGGHHTVIVVNSPGYAEWGREPQPFVCQGCGYSGFSQTFTVSKKEGLACDGADIMPSFLMLFLACRTTAVT